MTITNILTVSTFAILLSACSSQQKLSSSQSQVEGAPSAVVMAGKGSQHVHNVEDFGDFKHQHSGNSTAGHGHAWKEINDEITKSGLR